jgi:hypothetical protein
MLIFSARVARARGALESVLRKSQVFKEASTPKVTVADYQKRFVEGATTEGGLTTEESSVVQKPDTGAGMIPNSVKEALRAKGLSDEQINGIVQVASKEEAANLPAGTLYMQDGNIKRKK